MTRSEMRFAIIVCAVITLAIIVLAYVTILMFYHSDHPTVTTVQLDKGNTKWSIDLTDKTGNVYDRTIFYLKAQDCNTLPDIDFWQSMLPDQQLRYRFEKKIYIVGIANCRGATLDIELTPVDS